MISLIRGLSIRNKIIAMNLSSCLVVLLLASLVFVGSTTLIYRQAVIDELESIAKVLGYNSRAALVFNDREGATSILAALESKPNITFAQIMAKDGTVVAQYRSEQADSPRINEPSVQSYHHPASMRGGAEGIVYHGLGFLSGSIDIYTPIYLDGEVIGTILVESNLTAVFAIIKTNIAIAFLAILFASVIAFFYASRLQGVISQPILHLLDTMRNVSSEKNYTARAKRYGDDELGALTDGFNDMLTHIQARDSEVEVARQHAEASSQAKSAFLANVSHELRTPLNAILGFSDILKGEAFGPLGSDHYREYSEDIYSSGEHLLSLINDILDLSKIEAGSEELYEEEIDASDLVNSAVRLVKQRAQRSEVALNIDLAEPLPILSADERKLKQILVNLLTNAIKFTPAGGRVTLKAWCRPESGFVFQVADSGIGIAPNDIPKALAQFGQVDGGLNRQHEGTGLGLPLSKSLAELHGGSLDLQSELGNGTTVTVRLPAHRISGAEEQAALPDELQQMAG